MCNLIVFSTTSDEDFSVLQPGHEISIRPIDDATEQAAASKLSYTGRWVVVRYGGCSCHFRHDINGHGFEPPEDWRPEDPDDVEATLAICRLFKRVVAEGHRLDVLDIWEGDARTMQHLTVDLSAVPDGHFRFLEGSLLDLVASPNTWVLDRALAP